MTLSDDDLLDFDYRALSLTPADAEELLAKHGDLYRHQLETAESVDRWRNEAYARDPEHLEGFRNALAAVAANMRQGMLLGDAKIRAVGVKASDR